nr:glycosyltransferase family 2 protein [uncultured Bacteroides sp.]
MEKKLPLISLGIPVYNAAGLIEQTLLSVLNQTYPNIEYLLIDDKGDSMDIVHKVVGKHPRGGVVKIIDQGQNMGIGMARNAILDNATGEYLFTMDCDDVIALDCIETLYGYMSEHPVDFVAGSFVRKDMDGHQYAGCQYTDTLIEGNHYPVARYRYGQKKEIFVATWNKLYSLAFLRHYHIRCKEGHFNEDPWFTYQVIINASSCRLVPEYTLFYTCNPQSVSGISAVKGYSPQIARQFVEIQKLKSAYIRSLVSEDFYRDLLLDIMQMSIYHAYRICCSVLLPKKMNNELLREILTLSCFMPQNNVGKKSFKYMFFRFIFALPMCCKLVLIKLTVKIHVKQKIRKWIHFNS